MKERVNNSWGCPYEDKGICTRVKGKACDPGMPGCILWGRFTWSDPSKNVAKKPPKKPVRKLAPS